MRETPPAVILITQYFPPEKGAAQNRLSGLVEVLAEEGFRVTVITAMPSYPEGRVYPGYRGDLFVAESRPSARVLRGWSWVGGRGMFSRAIGFLTFSVAAFLIGLTRGGRAELVICECPPLSTAVPAWLLARLRRARLVTNVSDLWTDSLVDLGIIRAGWLCRTSLACERFLYRRSMMVSGQTEHIVSRLQALSPDSRVTLWRSGADGPSTDGTDVAPISPRAEWGIPAGVFVAGYAGLIGRSQGLNVLTDAAAILRDEQIWFVVIGDGPERRSLREMCSVRGLERVVFPDPVKHARMGAVWAAFDCAVVCLKKGRVFEGAVPSKLYEALAHGLPVVAALAGEGARLVEESGAGMVVEPENPSALAAVLRSLAQSPLVRADFAVRAAEVARARFDRKTLVRRFVGELRGLLDQ